MSAASFIWVELIAAAVVVAWILACRPRFGPSTLRGAVVAFLAAVSAPKVALAVLPLVARLPFGVHIALLTIVSPTLIVMLLGVCWLLRAVAQQIGSGPPGGHRVRLRAARGRS